MIKDIATCKTLTVDEELKLTEAVKKKGTDCDEMKKLEQAMVGFVVRSAKQLMNKGLAFEELIEAGTIGLRKAAMKYNINSDTMFLIYGVWEIQQVMKKAIEEKK